MDLVCTVTRGRLQPADPAKWAATLSRLDGKTVTVQIKAPVVQRTPNQNRWYWSQLVPLIADFLSEVTGKFVSNDDAHYLLKTVFLGTEKTPLGTIPHSTRGLSVEQFSKYCERIVAHAASEWGLYAPERSL